MRKFHYILFSSLNDICRFFLWKCVVGCIFAPYFDSEQGAAHFAAVHKVFGASNVSKLLLHIPVHKRLDAVVTICYEAQARLRDPVYGCVAHIFALQQQRRRKNGKRLREGGLEEEVRVLQFGGMRKRKANSGSRKAQKCVVGCIFAPYFDSEQGAAHFAAVHKVFGASNVSKLLLHIPVHKRLDAVVTICYEAQARLRDPVYGCVAHIFALQQQITVVSYGLTEFLCADNKNVQFNVA
uniref:LOB domain-containing protein n=1 Tax=Chenopodium quinoa TaxID=63459 RepID=A0A803KYW5_CHEQI